MRNWLSNSRIVLKQIGEPESLKSGTHVLYGSMNENVLGMWWSLDRIIVFCDEYIQPFGIIGFVTVLLKIFMQGSC